MSDFQLDGIDLAEIFGTSEGFEIVGADSAKEESPAEEQPQADAKTEDEEKGDDSFDMFGFFADLGNAFSFLSDELSGEGEDGENRTLEYGVDIEWPKLC